MKRAGIGARLLALAIDYLVLEIFLSLALFPLKERFSITDLNTVFLSDPLEMDRLSGILILYSTMIFITLIFWGFYFTFFHWASGQTLGKKILRIKVVRLDGSSPGLGCAFVRWAGFMFGLFFLGLGLLWAAFDSLGRAWHDKMAGTIVIADI
jgi:uncharacterized RDD family membrane protein YckC